ncbi:uncharacterized protein LOC125769355 isoform X2 [Anopheles funestus]|uniref:uncharacterized protein LOC125769355 isoform X2 n=1 Tax=Anopheles funestus TaxID=62324 RepID=UPI0020C6F3B3|nr:uncharacterized protein LOC125769355 isoform X2 [Anopheles funestus]
MDDACNERLRQEVQEWLRKAMVQIKLVKDEEFCRPVVKNLEQLNDFILKNNRLQTSTLEECKKLVQTALRKTLSKLVLENYTDDDSFGFVVSSTLQSFLSSDSTGRKILNDIFVARTEKLPVVSEQRLALKYPRKKIGAPSNIKPCNISHDIAEHSSSSLFKRRHEVFDPPPQPATYGEHKRMKLQLQEDIRKQDIPKAATDIQINQEDSKKQNTLKDARKQDIPKAATDIQINQEDSKKQNTLKDPRKQDIPKAATDIQINQEDSKKQNTLKDARKQDIPKAATGIQMNQEDSKKQNTLKDARKQDIPKAATDIQMNQEDSKKQNTLKDARKQDIPKAATDIQINQEDSKKRNTLKDASKQDIPKPATDVRVTVKNNDKPLNIPKQCTNNPPKLCNSHDIVGDNSQIDNRNDVCVLPETTNKIAHQQSESECSTKDFESNGESNDQIIENVQQSKPNHKNKVNHRELHELLSYTAEIFPKLSRRKRVSPEEEHNRQLLQKFGITKTVQIVLEPIDYSLGTGREIAQRTRSKSIDSTKYLKNLEAAKPSVPVPSKISHRRESRSMELNKQLTETTLTTPNVGKTKSTARKSVSKSQNNVQPKTSRKNSANITKVLQDVTTEEAQKLLEPNTASKKNIGQSLRAPRAKRFCSDIRVVQNDVQKLREDSDEDEPIVQANEASKRNPQLNNDPKVHCYSQYMEKCCLCSYTGELMVQHYVYNHPKKAVYISRLDPKQARQIRADPFVISGRKAVSRYGDQEILVFRCHFCDLRLSESQEIWLDHISKHTGEYRYKCMSCPTFSRHPTNRVTHNSICTNPSMQLWHRFTFEENHLYAYMCNECNFVQVLFFNMLRHLREDHSEAGPIEGRYTKFSMINFNVPEEDTELPYGMVKLEPILDDTNAPMEEIIKQEVEFTLAEDSQTQSTVSFQDIVQEQLSPDVIFIKEEFLTNDIDQSETSTSEGITEERCEPQESRRCSRSSSVRVKRLPGDTLSSKEDNIVDIASRNSKPVGNSSFLKEYMNQIKYSTSNTGSTDTTNSRSVHSGNNQHHAASSTAALQPWNGKNSNKMVVHTSKLTVPFLIAPFKCTKLNCGFYTDTSREMGSHFQRHQKPNTVHPITRDSSWLECCYCNYVSLSVHNLLKHIETVHKYCAYQCDRCCYRSRDPYSVRVHQQNYHLEYDANAKILSILSRQKEYSSMDRDIIMNHLKSNVKVLQCANCSSRKFNDLEQYRNHIKTHGVTYIACHVCDQLIAANKMVGHISSHNINMIQCIYCDYGINDLTTIKKHIADKHSDKLFCYHIRCSKPNVPPFIRVQSRISPERFVNC